MNALTGVLTRTYRRDSSIKIGESHSPTVTMTLRSRTGSRFLFSWSDSSNGANVYELISSLKIFLVNF